MLCVCSFGCEPGCDHLVVLSGSYLYVARLLSFLFLPAFLLFLSFWWHSEEVAVSFEYRHFPGLG